MCSLTILQYTRCSCNARDGNDGDGFIVTKDWHRRLALDRDAVPFERCMEAKLHAMDPTQSSTLEFARCKNIQVTTIRFEGEVCFRCLMHQRGKERAEKIRTLLAEHKSFAARYAATKESAAAQAEPSREIWQSMRLPSQRDRSLVDTIRDVRAIWLQPLDQGTEGWERVLEKQLACRDLKRERNAQNAVKASFRESQELLKKRIQFKLLDLQERLTQANKRAVSPILEEKGEPVLEPGDAKQDPTHHHVQIQKLRVTRLKRFPGQNGPMFDLKTPYRNMKKVVEKDSLAPEAPAPNPVKELKQNIPGAHSAYTKARTIGPSTILPPGQSSEVDRSSNNGQSIDHAISRALSTLSAEVAEFRPFVRAPPTEPLMMRAPTAPRAMRERTYSSLSRTIWQPRRQFATVRGYATVRGWQY